MEMIVQPHRYYVIGLFPFYCFLFLRLFGIFSPLLPRGPIKLPGFLFIAFFSGSYTDTYSYIRVAQLKIKIQIIYTWTGTWKRRSTALSLIVAVFIPKHLLLTRMCIYKYIFLLCKVGFVYLFVLLLALKQNWRFLYLQFSWIGGAAEPPDGRSHTHSSTLPELLYRTTDAHFRTRKWKEKDGDEFWSAGLCPRK